MRHFLYSFIYLTFFSFIYSNNLQFTNASIMAGESGTIDLLLDNPEDQIAGIQFQIIDYPNQGSFTDIQATDRLGDFMVESYEQEDGSIIIVGFSLTGSVIDIGQGPILSLTYQSTSQYSSEINISLIFFF